LQVRDLNLALNHTRAQLEQYRLQQSAQRLPAQQLMDDLKRLKVGGPRVDGAWAACTLQVQGWTVHGLHAPCRSKGGRCMGCMLHGSPDGRMGVDMEWIWYLVMWDHGYVGTWVGPCACLLG